MKTLRLSVVCFLSVLFFDSCAPAYVPTAINTPMFSKKNEANASLLIGSCGIDPQLSYAISDHIGMMLNSSFKNFELVDISTNKHFSIESGLGYFSKSNSNFIHEYYAGIGYCSSSIINPDIDTYISGEGNYIKFFIQPSFGFKNISTELSFTPRVVIVDYLTDSYSNEQLRTGFEYVFEPVITFKFGKSYIKGILQSGLTIHSKDRPLIDYFPGFFSVGIQLEIDRLIKDDHK